MKFDRPVSKGIKISSPYGVVRKLEVYGNKEQMHNGVDFAAPEKTEVMAICDGEVCQAGWQDTGNHGRGFGLRIWQRSKIGNQMFDIFYGHLSEVLCKQGEKLIKGQKIGLTGTTGTCTGPHLHVGLRTSANKEWVPLEFDS